MHFIHRGLYHVTFYNSLQKTSARFYSIPSIVPRPVPNGYWKIKDNQLEYMNWLSQKLNIKTMEDWYKVSQEDIIQSYGATFIKYNNKSHIKLIISVYPDYNWLLWKFNHTPKGFWKDENNIKEYMKWLSDRLNIKTMEDWYKVSKEDIIQNYGSSLIKLYSNSNINLITNIYRNYQWLPWKFNQSPKKFWNNEKNVKEYIKWLSEKLKIKTLEDWYEVSQEDVIQNYGSTLIKLHGGSYTKMITSIYPNYNWLPWKFKYTTKGFWKDENNVKTYMNWLSKTLNINTMEDWYKISQENILNNYGGTLIGLYGGSTVNLIKSVYPDYNWLPWKFNYTPKGFWKDENNIKEYMKWLSDRLNIKTMEDWYKVSREDLMENYGGTLIHYKNNSNEYSKFHEILQTIYPEHKWDVFQFLKVPNGYKTNILENSSLQKEFINYLEKKFSIKQTNDWYSITNDQLKQVISIDMKTTMKIIKKFYPDIDINKYDI